MSSSGNLPIGLNGLDLGIVAAYLAGVTVFGLRFRKHRRTLKDYFLADKQIPWWAIALSIVAAETSTLTIISVPGLAYGTDFRFLQLIIGYLIGRVIVSFLLIPHYFRGELMTAYELIEWRFGHKLHRLTAGMFLITRAAAEGVRVFAVAIVVQVALGGLLTGMSDLQRDLCAIAVVTVLTLAYTFEGGMAAVIWTDVLQLAIYVTGTIVAFFTILHAIPGGWPVVHSVAADAGKFRVFDFSWSMTTTYTFWSGVIGGTFFTLGSHGTDQLIVQRLLAARNQRESKTALIASGVFVFFQFSLFLLIGAMLFVYYRFVPNTGVFTRTDMIYPAFIVSRMPHGVSGLLISAILAAAMCNLSAALNSLSSTSIVDFYGRLRPATSEQRQLFLSRMATVFWAVVLFVLAILARRSGKVIEAGLSIASVAYGSLLGVFLLGILTKTVSERGAIAGMIAGFAFNLFLWLRTGISFTWYVVLGGMVTMTVGYAASLALPREQRDAIAARKQG